MAGEDHFRKSFVNRISSLEGGISAFSLYIVFKPKTFKYLNRNYYHFKNSNEFGKPMIIPKKLGQKRLWLR